MISCSPFLVDWGHLTPIWRHQENLIFFKLWFMFLAAPVGIIFSQNYFHLNFDQSHPISICSIFLSSIDNMLVFNLQQIIWIIWFAVYDMVVPNSKMNIVWSFWVQVSVRPILGEIQWFLGFHGPPTAAEQELCGFNKRWSLVVK